MAGVWSSRLRRSSAQIDELSAEEGRGAHREFYGGVRGVRKSSEAGRRRRRQRLEREEDAGEMEPGRIKTKKRNRWYIRARWAVVELEVTSASRFKAPERRSYGGGDASFERTGKREDGGAARVFIGGRAAAYKEGERGALR